MTILVTGGAGYIGSHMVWALLEAGEDVVVIDNYSTGFDWALPQEVRAYEGDIGNVEFLKEIFRDNKIEAIFHFAGSTVVPESVTNPLKYYNNNTANSRTLIESAALAGVSNFIFSSTAAVYGTPDDKGLVKENMPLRPESPYGHSKLMTEVMLKHAAEAHGFNYTVLRYFNVAGADPQGRTGQSTENATHLIKAACATALGNRPAIEVFGTNYDTVDGTCVRDYIHVCDLVQAHLLALKRMRRGGAPLIANCGYGVGFSVLQVLDAVQNANGGKPFPIKCGPRRPGDPVTVVADPSLAKQELEWIPAHDDLNTIVESALRWERHLKLKNSRFNINL